MLLESYPKIYFQDQEQKAFSSMLSSKSFMILGLKTKFLIYFKLIVVSGLTQGCTFIFLHVYMQFSQHRLLKRLSFSHFVLIVFNYFQDVSQRQEKLLNSELKQHQLQGKEDYKYFSNSREYMIHQSFVFIFFLMQKLRFRYYYILSRTLVSVL